MQLDPSTPKVMFTSNARLTCGTSKFFGVNETRAAGGSIFSVRSWSFLSVDSFATRTVCVAGDVVTPSKAEPHNPIGCRFESLGLLSSACGDTAQ